MRENIIWTNGCYDILHRGHIELFKYAKSLGNKLIVGIDSDEKVRMDKGDFRPFNKLEDRKEMLRAIKYVDEIVHFDSKSELRNLIKIIRPDIMVVGSDWKNKDIVGEEYAKKINFFERLENYSTTKILEYNKRSL